MRKIPLILFAILILIAPVLVSAECSKNGTTVVFVNGIFTSNREDAMKGLSDLKKYYILKGNNIGVDFKVGFNKSQMGGINDIVHVATQIYGYVGRDYNMTNILLQLYDNLKTQKVLLVGHSQGTFYTNIAYDYLISHGVPKESIAVYNVATPADWVAGSEENPGKYLTSSTDKVISRVVAELAKKVAAHPPLPPNIDLVLPEKEAKDELGGHAFSEVYLALAPDRIISDMDDLLDNLKTSDNYSQLPDGSCFVVPSIDFVYEVQDNVYNAVAQAPQFLPTSPFHSPQQLASFGNSLFSNIFSFGKNVYNDIAGGVSNMFSKIGSIFAGTGPEVFITSTVPGYSVQESTENPLSSVGYALPAEDVGQQSQEPENINNSGTGGLDIQVLTEQERQDLLDDIQEKIDIIRQQVQLLVQQQNPSDSQGQDQNLKENDNSQNNNNQNNNTDNNQNNNTSNTNNSGGASWNGGGGTISYPKIIISEVQILPAQQRFIELYNPNSQDVDLTDWYIQRKDNNDTSWGSLVSSTHFSGKIILAKGYFYISESAGNILLDFTLSNDNSLALKNPNRDIVDKLGFGLAQDPENSPTLNPDSGQSIGRKNLLDSEQDTDNNLADFELQTPTPGEKNVTYVAPPAQPKILINEVQISGATDEKEEFIELYNPNSQDVDLTDWYIQRKTKTGASYSSYAPNSLFLGKTIMANSYFLIARSGSSFEASAEVVTTYSLGDYAADTGSTLVLKRGDQSISDKVGFGQAQEYENSPAQIPAPGQSTQRVWNVATSQPQDTDNNAVDFQIFNNPTPRAENPKFYLYSNFIFTEDTILKKALCPYLFSGNISINQGVTLTIEPGCVIKFNSGASLLVNGNVQAVGSNTDKIIFTSFKDDDCGTTPACGDTNGDSNNSTPNHGDWQGISFINGSSNSNFEHAYFRFGGHGLGVIGAAVKAENSPLIIKNSIFENNLNRGLYLVNSTATIDSNQFLDQTDPDMGSSFNATAIDVFGGSGQIVNNYLKNNNYGIALSDWSDAGNTYGPNFSVQNNSLEANYHAIVLNTFDGPSFSGNQILGDPDLPGTFAAILVNANVTEDVTLSPDLPYLVNRILAVSQGATLTLQPGVIVSFQSNWDGLRVDGTLKAVGTSNDKIIFRPYYYNRDWISPGNWDGLLFTNTSQNSELENIEIYLGGSFHANGNTDFGAAIRVEQSSITLKNSYIHDNKNSGLWLINSPSIIDSVSFFNHKLAIDGQVAKAIYIQGGSPEIKNSRFQSQVYGIYKDQAATPNLENNTFMDSDVTDIYTTP